MYRAIARFDLGPQIKAKLDFCNNHLYCLLAVAEEKITVASEFYSTSRDSDSFVSGMTLHPYRMT